VKKPTACLLAAALSYLSYEYWLPIGQRERPVYGLQRPGSFIPEIGCPYCGDDVSIEVRNGVGFDIAGLHVDLLLNPCIVCFEYLDLDVDSLTLQVSKDL
jgi:hypothetical protein